MYKMQQQIPKGPYVELLVSTWSKDSHALFDYEAVDNKFYNQSYYLTDSCKIYRHIPTMKTNIQQLSDTRELPLENIYIGTLLKTDNEYKLQSAAVSGVKPNPIIGLDHPDLFDNSYVVIRDFQHQYGYALKPGNVIRLGRVEYVVLQIKNNKGVQTFKQTSHIQLNKGTYQVTQKLSDGICKISLQQQTQENDPLIAPCGCKGSLAYIHVNCLKNWINSKVKKDVNGVVMSYNFSKFECELCKSLFPKIVKLRDGTQVQMISIEKPNKPYIILESLTDKYQSKEERNLHLICPQEGVPLKLGRGHQCQIRVTDISVSRSHAQIRFQNDRFYIKDMKSKFGTLIKFREEFDVKKRLRVQFGRTVFQFLMHNDKAEAETNEEE